MIAYDTSEIFHIYIFHMLLQITTYSSAMYTAHTSSFDVTYYTKYHLLKDKNIPMMTITSFLVFPIVGKCLSANYWSY